MLSAFSEFIPSIHHGNSHDYLTRPSSGSPLSRQQAQPLCGHTQVGFIPAHALPESPCNTTSPPPPAVSPLSSENATLASPTLAAQADCTVSALSTAPGAIGSVAGQAEEGGHQLPHDTVQRREVCCERTSRVAAPSVHCISKSLPQVVFASQLTVHPVFHASASLYPSFVQSSYYSSEMDMSSALSSVLSRKMTSIRGESGRLQAQGKTKVHATTPHTEKTSNIIWTPFPTLEPSAKLRTLQPTSPVKPLIAEKPACLTQRHNDKVQADSTQSSPINNKMTETCSEASPRFKRHPLSPSISQELSGSSSESKATYVPPSPTYPSSSKPHPPSSKPRPPHRSHLLHTVKHVSESECAVRPRGSGMGPCGMQGGDGGCKGGKGDGPPANPSATAPLLNSNVWTNSPRGRRKAPSELDHVDSPPEIPLVSRLQRHVKYHSMESLPLACSREQRNSQHGSRRHLFRRSIKSLVSLVSSRVQSNSHHPPHTASDSQSAPPDSSQQAMEVPVSSGLPESALLSASTEVLCVMDLSQTHPKGQGL